MLVTHDFEDVTRLATHLVLLDNGRSVAAGSIEGVTSRPDLPWLRAATGLGSVFSGQVVRELPDRRLVEVNFPGGTLVAPGRGLAQGQRVRIRIPAREVILASRMPEGLSVHNALAGLVSSVVIDPGGDYAVVQLLVGETAFLAEITPDAVTTLGLVAGVTVYLLIKSMSIDVG